jgi:adenylate cyclase
MLDVDPPATVHREEWRSMQAFLTFTHLGQERKIDCKEAMTLGRDEGCNVVLSDPRASRVHAMLYRTHDGSYYLADERSSNGCYVNAVRITLPTRLNDGDQISIGSTNLQFHHPNTATHHDAVRTGTRRTTLIVNQNVELLRIAILVADIRGFTRLSESLPVRPLTEMMNQWFRETTRCISTRDGVIDKFLGDCVYARWQANRDPVMALLHALDAACELNRITLRLCEQYPDLPQPLQIGVGINVGNAALGTDQGRTAIGDAVNLTFRLQEHTKQLGCDILLNRDAFQHLPADQWQGHEQIISVTGKTIPLEVWGLSFHHADTLLQTIRSA